MKKQHIITTCLLVMLGVAFLFFQNLRKTDQKPTIVSAVLPLTGELAYFGQPEKIALQMAVEDLTNNGTIPANSIDLKIEDSRSTPNDGLSAVRKLTQTSPAAMITSLTMISMPAQPILEEMGIPQLALSVHPTIQNSGSNVFRFYYGFDEEMTALAKFAKTSGAKRVAISWINTPELEVSINNILKPKLEEAGLSLVGTMPHTFTTTDFRSIMANLATAKPDLLILQDFGALLPAMVEAATNQGITNMAGGIGFMSSPEAARSKLAGIPFVCPSYIVQNSETFKAFDQRFREMSGGSAATYDVVFTYETMMILGKAISQNRSAGNKLIETLSSISTHSGITGDLIIEKRALSVPLAWAAYDSNGMLKPVSINQ